MSDVIDLVKGLNEDLQKGFNDLQKKSDVAICAIQKNEEVANSLKKDIENHKGKLERVVEEVLELQQKGVKLQMPEGQKSFIDLVKEDDSYQSVTKGHASAWQKEFEKSDLSSVLNQKADTTNLRSETVDNSIMLDPRTELSIRDLIPSVSLSTESYTYFKEGSQTLNAGMVSEGGLKPEQDASFEQVTDTVKKIAVWHRVSMEQLQDYPQIVSYIRQLLNYDIKLKEEEQILKGDGTGSNLNGLMTQASAYDSASLAAAGDTAVDTIRRMIYQVRKQDKSSPNAIVLTDKTWMDIELLKETTNAYLFANIQGIVSPLLWGRQVVVSDALDDASEEIIVGNMSRAARIYDRMNYTVKAGMINDDFIRNQSVILAEERIGLGVIRPNAIVKHQLV